MSLTIRPARPGEAPLVLGAVLEDGWTICRLGGAALARLAKAK